MLLYVSYYCTDYVDQSIVCRHRVACATSMLIASYGIRFVHSSEGMKPCALYGDNQCCGLLVCCTYTSSAILIALCFPDDRDFSMRMRYKQDIRRSPLFLEGVLYRCGVPDHYFAPASFVSWLARANLAVRTPLPYKTHSSLIGVVLLMQKNAAK